MIIRLRSQLRKLGFTLLELVVSFAVFVLAMGLLASILISSKALLTEVGGNADATQKIKKIFLAVNRELRATSYLWVKTDKMANMPGPGSAGDALWFLSSVDPKNGDVSARGDNGRPRWQRNVIYYPSVPTDHDSLYGIHCAGGADVEGYDLHCPHKVLIRKVVDSGPVSTYNDPDRVEEIIPESGINTYLNAPVGFTVPTIGQGTEQAQAVCPGILSFRAEKLASTPLEPEQIKIRLKVTNLEELGKKTALGTASLESAPQTESLEFCVFPENP